MSKRISKRWTNSSAEFHSTIVDVDVVVVRLFYAAVIYNHFSFLRITAGSLACSFARLLACSPIWYAVRLESPEFFFSSFLNTLAHVLIGMHSCWVWVRKMTWFSRIVFDWEEHIPCYRAAPSMSFSMFYCLPFCAQYTHIRWKTCTNSTTYKLTPNIDNQIYYVNRVPLIQCFVKTTFITCSKITMC